MFLLDQYAGQADAVVRGFLYDNNICRISSARNRNAGAVSRVLRSMKEARGAKGWLTVCSFTSHRLMFNLRNTGVCFSPQSRDPDSFRLEMTQGNTRWVS